MSTTPLKSHYLANQNNRTHGYRNGHKEKYWCRVFHANAESKTFRKTCRFCWIPNAMVLRPNPNLSNTKISEIQIKAQIQVKVKNDIFIQLNAFIKWKSHFNRNISINGECFRKIMLSVFSARSFISFKSHS